MSHLTAILILAILLLLNPYGRVHADSIGTLQPSIGSLQPSMGSFQPSIGSPQPSIGSPQTSIANLQPSIGNLQPNIANLQPSTGNVQPSIGSLQPSISSLQPSIGNLQPSIGSLVPSIGNLQPSIEQLTVVVNTVTTPTVFANTTPFLPFSGQSDVTTSSGISMTLTITNTAADPSNAPPLANAEPASILLLASGLAELAVLRKMRRNDLEPQ
jgi:hypothetical protein